MAPQCFSLLQELAAAGFLTAASLVTASGPHEAAWGASPLLSAIKSMLLSRSARRQEACVLLSRLMAHGPMACFPQLVELEVCEHLYELLRGAAGVCVCVCMCVVWTLDVRGGRVFPRLSTVPCPRLAESNACVAHE